MAKPSALVGLKTSMETEAAGSVPDSAGRTTESQRAKLGRPPVGEAGNDVRKARKATTVYFPPEVSKGLKTLALKEDTTLQALVGEAIDLLMRDRGLHPFGAR